MYTNPQYTNPQYTNPQYTNPKSKLLVCNFSLKNITEVSRSTDAESQQTKAKICQKYQYAWKYMLNCGSLLTGLLPLVLSCCPIPGKIFINLFNSFFPPSCIGQMKRGQK